jgi:L-threonylcarbamoyladenylate synthase
VKHARTLPFRTEEEQRAALDAAASHLEEGGLIACPTETVYGFGCLLQPDALARLAMAKRRDPERPFLLLVADRQMAGNLVWTAAANALADAFWPGPLTLGLAVKGDWPREVTSPAGTVAIRATAHAGMRALIRRCGEPITSTSANEPGAPAALDAASAARALASATGESGLVLDGGRLPASRPSTIVDCSVDPPVIVRAGAIDATVIAEILNGLEPPTDA